MLTKPIRVRPETRKKYEQVATAKRWKFVEVADAAIDALIEKDAAAKPKTRRTPSVGVNS